MAGTRRNSVGVGTLLVIVPYGLRGHVEISDTKYTHEQKPSNE